MAIELPVPKAQIEENIILGCDKDFSNWLYSIFYENSTLPDNAYLLGFVTSDETSKSTFTLTISPPFSPSIGLPDVTGKTVCQ